MDDMDQITALVHKINIESDIRGDYESAFEDIVRFVKNHRKHEITEHELEVTKTLAAQFTRGGSLVLLLEPRRWHPWKLGVRKTDIFHDAISRQLTVSNLNDMPAKNPVGRK
jgi:hypothetical protein